MSFYYRTYCICWNEFKRGVATSRSASRWPNGIIPYEIVPGYGMFLLYRCSVRITRKHAIEIHFELLCLTQFTNKIVPYSAAAEQATIIATLTKLENLLAINNVRCIRFRPKNPSDIYFVRFFNGVSCSSPVSYSGVVRNPQWSDLNRALC
jgi:hypothetical protein